jgi:hypothetical protein
MSHRGTVHRERKAVNGDDRESATLSCSRRESDLRGEIINLMCLLYGSLTS